MRQPNCFCPKCGKPRNGVNHSKCSAELQRQRQARDKVRKIKSLKTATENNLMFVVKLAESKENYNE